MSVCQEEAKPAVPSVSQGALPPTPPGTMAFAVTCPGDVTPGGPMAVPPWDAKYGLASRYPSDGGLWRAGLGRAGGVTRVCVGCVDWIVGARGWFASAQSSGRDRHHIMASVNRYPRAVLSTPGTSGYRLSYKLLLRAVPLRWGIF